MLEDVLESDELDATVLVLLAVVFVELVVALVLVAVVLVELAVALVLVVVELVVGLEELATVDVMVVDVGVFVLVVVVLAVVEPVVVEALVVVVDNLEVVVGVEDEVVDDVVEARTLDEVEDLPGDDTTKYTPAAATTTITIMTAAMTVVEIALCLRSMTRSPKPPIYANRTSSRITCSCRVRNIDPCNWAPEGLRNSHAPVPLVASVLGRRGASILEEVMLFGLVPMALGALSSSKQRNSCGLLTLGGLRAPSSAFSDAQYLASLPPTCQR